MFSGALGHADHEGRSLRMLHDAPHLVDDQQPRLGVLRRCCPHRLRAHHRRRGAEFRLQEPEVKYSYEGLVGQQIVTFV